MRLEKITLEKTNRFSPVFLDYIHKSDKLKPYYKRYPSLPGLQQAAKEKVFPEARRKVLQEVLRQQYHAFHIEPAVQENLNALSEAETYTIATGHQLNLFTGPLFFIYKIVTTINLARQLSEAYPSMKFIPVYWMASEDHDFDEISQFRLFDQLYTWKTSQKGAVGRFSNEGVEEVLASLPEAVPLFEKAYREHKTLSEATRFLVNELFGQQGLLILDADNPKLKAEFSDFVHQDIFEGISNRLVEDTSQKLNKNGYKSQVYSRKINFFYLDKNQRQRIVFEDGKYQLVDGSRSFTADELGDLIRKKPENFSPNVITRPLYQETILPNLAYVGGPAEIAYWFQIRDIFRHYQLDFPILVPRNFALVVNKSNTRKLQKLDLKASDLFSDEDSLREQYLIKNAHADYHLSEQQSRIKAIFEEITQKAAGIDKSLTGVVGAEHNKVAKIVANLEKRMKKSEENRQEVALRQVHSLKEKLFPNGQLQERMDNVLNFYLNDTSFISKIAGVLDPLDFRFNILIEE